MRCKLSEMLERYRCDRPNEWTMDEFIRDAKKLEAELEALKISSNPVLADSADDECPDCGKLKNEDGTCDCPESWTRHCR